MTAKAKLVAGAMLTLFGLSRPSNGAALKVGQSAPDFALKDQNGNTVKLSAYRGQRSVVLAFYIRAFTPG